MMYEVPGKVEGVYLALGPMGHLHYTSKKTNILTGTESLVLQFTCQAHRDEYVINDDNPGTFTASNGTLRHTQNERDSTVTISVSGIHTISFERNTTLHRTRFLGVFFGIISILLLALFYMLVFLGEVENLNQAAIAFFVLLFAIGGFSTTFEYLRQQNHVVIDVYIKTSEGQLVVCGRVDNTRFVESCSKLIESDLPTTIRDSKIESALN